MILLTHFLDKHMHAFGLTELNYLFLIVITINHDEFMSYKCRAESVLNSDQIIWLPSAGHYVRLFDKSSSALSQKHTERQWQEQECRQHSCPITGSISPPKAHLYTPRGAQRDNGMWESKLQTHRKGHPVWASPRAVPGEPQPQDPGESPSR